MGHHDTSSQELLANWARERCEDSFRELVKRHADLIFSAAMRTTNDAQIAEDALQLTFISVAQKSHVLMSHPALLGWLQVCSVQHARNLARKRDRDARKVQSLEVHMLHQMDEEPRKDWIRLSPVLDDAMRRLPTADREIILQRYYGARSIKELASHLGIAAEAATKRLTRATTKLKGILQKMNCRTRSEIGAVLTFGFSEMPQVAIPTISAISAKAIAAGGIKGASTITTLLSTIYFMKKTTLAAVILVLASLGTIGVVSLRKASPAAAPESKQQVGSASAKLKSAIAESAPERSSKAQAASRAAVREEEMKQKYGEARMNLARKVSGNLVKIFVDVCDLEESTLLSGPKGEAKAKAMLAKDLPGFSEIVLTEEQKSKLVGKLMAAMQRTADEHRKATEAMKADPSGLMEHLLVEDAAAKGLITPAEADKQQKTRDLPVEEMLGAVDLGDGSDVKSAPWYPQFKKDVAEVLDQGQYQKWEMANREETSDPAKEAEFADLEEMESISSTGQMLMSGIKKMVEAQQKSDEN